MYAILKTGGRQVKVAPGDVLRIERQAGQKAEKGQTLELKDVVLVSGDKSDKSDKSDKVDKIRTGAAELKGALVKATVLNEVRNRKVIVFKKKRTKQYRRTNGHRQTVLEVRIDGIEG